MIDLLLYLLALWPVVVVVWCCYRVCMIHPHDEQASRSEQGVQVRAFQIATLSAAVSCVLWVWGYHQIGNVLAVFPGLALCVGLFAVTVGILGIVRYPRKGLVALTILACVPPAWSIYYLLILHPRSL
ncbi:hypothetical protein Pan153_02170 [Gimesia panareensis]|uniref:Uncharacterized protein n=1 Tax=Gimesia panareensis TaxID=2527978 RepID=A0A518FGY8_9PLAN|nr:hypothetical protein Pan153_02170 [Gimesia panareensis]